MRIFTDLNDPALIEMIKEGAVGVLPTDTVYGLVSSARKPEAVARMYALKQREHKPGTTIAASTQQLQGLGLNPHKLAQAARFWPASLSISIPQDEATAYIHQGTGRSSFRVVSDPVVNALLQATGPLVTSSANQPGEPPAENLQQAQAYFGDQVDFYVATQLEGPRLPSTIAELAPDGRLHVVRQGAVTVKPEDQA